MAGMIAKYIVLPGVIAFSLMQLAKPSEAEIKKITDYTKKNDAYSKVLKAAAAPGSKPIYRQKPGEQHPLPELAESAGKV